MDNELDIVVDDGGHKKAWGANGRSATDRLL